MMTNVALTRDELNALAEKAGAYIHNNMPMVIHPTISAQINVLEYTRKIVELVKANDRVKGVSDERAEFEKAYRKLKKSHAGDLDFHMRRNSIQTDKYYESEVITAWELWQARSQLSNQKISPTETFQLHEIFGSIEECPPILETDSFIVKNVKVMAQLINSQPPKEIK